MTETETTNRTEAAGADRLFRVHLRTGITVAIRARDENAMQKLAGKAVKRFEEITREELKRRFGMTTGYHARRIEKIYAFLVSESALPETACVEKHSSPLWGRNKRTVCIAATGGRSYNGRVYKSVRLWVVLN